MRLVRSIDVIERRGDLFRSVLELCRGDVVGEQRTANKLSNCRVGFGGRRHDLPVAHHADFGWLPHLHVR
jgi:hypothetical protein